jgi:hypothetical protein
VVGDRAASPRIFMLSNFDDTFQPDFSRLRLEAGLRLLCPSRLAENG